MLAHRVPPATVVRPLAAARFPATRRARSRSPASTWLDAPRAAGSARTTTREPPGILCRRVAISARRRRLTVFRSTAPPTARETTNPTRQGPCEASLATWTTTRSDDPRRPRRSAVAKSPRRRRRCRAGSTGHSGRELGATLATARGENGPTGSRPHTQTKTVRLGATPVVGLEGPLAHGSSPQLSRMQHPRSPVGARVRDPASAGVTPARAPAMAADGARDATLSDGGFTVREPNGAGQTTALPRCQRRTARRQAHLSPGPVSRLASMTATPGRGISGHQTEEHFERH